MVAPSAVRSSPTSRWVDSISRAMSIIGLGLLLGAPAAAARRRRSRLPRASSVSSELRRWSQNPRKCSSQPSTSRNGALSTA